MASLSTIQEAFTNTATPTGWTLSQLGSATATQDSTGCSINLPATTSSSTDGDMNFTATNDLTGSFARINVLGVSGASATHTDNVLRVRQNSTNYYTMFYEAGTLFFSKVVASSQTNIASVAFNATTHAWWQVRHKGASVYGEFSADGVTWTQLGVDPTAITITAVDVLIGALCFGVDTSPSPFKFRYFNYPLSGTTTSTSSTSASSTSASTSSTSSSSTSSSISSTSSSLSTSSTSSSLSSTSSSISSTSSSTSSTSLSSTSSSTSISSTSSSISSTSQSSTSLSSTSSSTSVSSTSTSFSSTSSSVSSTSNSTSSTSFSSTSSSSSTSSTTLPPPNLSYSYVDSLNNAPLMSGFPSAAAVLDTFTRADSTPDASTNWAKAFPSIALHKITSNQAATATTGGGAWQPVISFDQEAYVDVATVPTGTNYVEVIVRNSSPLVASNFYGLYLKPASNLIQPERVVNGAGTDMGGGFSQAVASGDGIGIRIAGITLTYWYRSGAGSWTKLGTLTDDKLKQPGRIGFFVDGTTARADNFGGGAITQMNTFTNAQYSYVGGDDGDYFIEFGSEYMITDYQRKHTNNTDTIQFTWRSRSTVSTATSPIYVQIYNLTTSLWESLAVVNKIPADVDFSVTVRQTTSLSSYYDSTNTVTFRSYQQVI